MMLRSLENQPLNHHLETNLHVYGGLYSIDGLRTVYETTPYADAQRAMMPRFSKGYSWDDIDKFKELYGPDVNMMQHGTYQARTIAIPMIDAQRKDKDLPRVSPEFADHFVTHHVQHDDHEGEFGRLRGEIHDVPHREKTAEISTNELDLWFKIQRELFGKLVTLPHFKYVKSFEAENDTFESVFWNISERIGYLATGVRAAQLAFETEGLTEAERKTSKLMARRVIGRHYPIIEAVQNTVAYANYALKLSNWAVSKVCEEFDLTRQELFDVEQ